MVKIWSELPGARTRELVADLATIAWVAFWSSMAWTLYSFLASFAEAGRLIRDGGENLQAAGRSVGEGLRGLPIVGEGAASAVRGGFDGAGEPIVAAGRDLETFVIVVAVTLALVLLLVPLIPWLSRYLPWRLERARRLRAAHQAIRRPAATGGLDREGVERVLAGRALNRLDWPTLLDYTPDPIGDWTSGRFDRLARAELEGAGLRSILAGSADPPRT